MANLVLLTDFGNKEHFVAAMKGVALSASRNISIFDITGSDNQTAFNDKILFVKSFGYAVQSGSMAYIDSSGVIGIAVNSDSFAKRYHIHYGNSWRITISVD